MDEQILYNNLKIIYDFYIKTKNENFIRIEYIYIDDYDYFYKQSVCNENFYNGYVRHLLQIIKNCNLQYNTIYSYNIRQSAFEGSLNYSSIIVDYIKKFQSE